MIAFTRAVLALLVISQLAFAADKKKETPEVVVEEVAGGGAPPDCPEPVQPLCEMREVLVSVDNAAGCPTLFCHPPFEGAIEGCEAAFDCKDYEELIEAFDVNGCPINVCYTPDESEADA